jgi:hypothetical protein
VLVGVLLSASNRKKSNSIYLRENFIKSTTSSLDVICFSDESVSMMTSS